MLDKAKRLFWCAIGAALVAAVFATASLLLRNWPLYVVNMLLMVTCTGIAYVNLRTWRKLELGDHQ